MSDPSDWSPDDGCHYRAGYELGRLDQDQARESLRDGQGDPAAGRLDRLRARLRRELGDRAGQALALVDLGLGDAKEAWRPRW